MITSSETVRIAYVWPSCRTKCVAPNVSCSRAPWLNSLYDRAPQLTGLKNARFTPTLTLFGVCVRMSFTVIFFSLSYHPFSVLASRFLSTANCP